MGRSRALGGFGVEESRVDIDSCLLCKVSGFEDVCKAVMDRFLSTG